MIISNTGKYIFIHIPKTGGSTVSRLLNARLRAQDVTLNLNPTQGWGPYLDAYQKRFGLVKHSTGADICRSVGAVYFEQYYAFLFCRNPYARAYSAFTFTKSSDEKLRPQSERYQDIKDMDFEAFLKSKYMQEKKIFQARPQTDWIRDVEHKIDHYRLENFNEEIQRVFAKIGGGDFDLSEVKILNQSAPQGAWRNMSAEAAQLIRDLYAEDFENFGYSQAI